MLPLHHVAIHEPCRDRIRAEEIVYLAIIDVRLDRLQEFVIGEQFSAAEEAAEIGREAVSELQFDLAPRPTQ
ncbi:MAG: hypothetical protein WD060_14795 [Pirellulales bacterium]